MDDLFAVYRDNKDDFLVDWYTEFQEEEDSAAESCGEKLPGSGQESG